MAEARERLQVLVTMIAVAMGLFHLYTAQFGLLSAMRQRSVHLGLGLILVFLLKPASKALAGRNWAAWGDLLLGLLAVAFNAYIYTQFESFLDRFGIPTTADYVLGFIGIVLVLEATRRVVGWTLPVLAVVFILYSYFGRYFPGFLAHRGYDLDRIVNLLFLTTEGLYGGVLGVSANFIVLYVILAAFLEASGAGESVIRLATSLAGGWRGGPAKVAVGASGLFASINGTAIANVLSTGSFTIPLMQKVGYRPKFAAAVEAVASTGGQLAPPVMGSAAFIMADILQVPYVNICLAALIPAILYYWSTWVMVDFRAAKLNLQGQPASELPDWKREILHSGYMLAPLSVLIFFLGVMRLSPMKSGVYAIYATVLISLFRRSTRLTIPRIVQALTKGIQLALVIVVACATAGLVIGCLNLTGLGLKLTSGLVDLAGGSMFVLLVFTALASIVMGMGLPTVACYVILAIMVAPALVETGMLPIAAHMFVFYFGILSAITPPIAGAAFAAGGIAGTRLVATAFAACRLGVIAFILPFMFAYWPALLWEGTALQIGGTFVSAFIGVYFMSAGIEGYLLGPLSWPLRIILLAGAFLCISPEWYSDILGYSLLGLGLAVCLIRRRSGRALAAGGES